MTVRFGAAVVVAVLATAEVWAQVAGTAMSAFVDPAGGISLDEAIATALEREPLLRSARAEIDVARGQRAQAGRRPNPSVTFDHRREPAGTDNETTLEAAWPLDLFRRQSRTAVADREIAAAEARTADRQRILAAAVRAQYGRILHAVRELALVDELRSVTERQHVLLQSQVREGASPAIERDLLQIEVRRLESERLLQLGRAESAVLELKRLLGMDPGSRLLVRDTLEEAVRRESRAAATVPAADDRSQTRPDVRAAEARIRIADAKIDRAAREGRVDLSLFAGYMRSDSGFPQLGLSRAGSPQPIRNVFHELSGGATVSIPVFDRRQGDRAAAEAERAGAIAAYDAARLDAQTEIAVAVVRDRRSHEAVAAFEDGTRALARQNLTVVRQAYELGRATVFDVLAEQRRYVDLDRAYGDALRAAFDARTELGRAIGDVR